MRIREVLDKKVGNTKYTRYITTLPKGVVKDSKLPTAVDIFGDYVVTFVGVKPGELYEEPLQFILKSRLLADGYRKYFEFMWDNCKE